MNTQNNIPEAEIVRIVQAYYDAVDSHDPDRLVARYLDSPTTTLQFNSDEPIVTIDAIRAFTAQFVNAVSSIRHSRIDVWIQPLMGNVVPTDLLAERSISTLTVVSTALPIFTIGEGESSKRIMLPATSIFTIDIASKKLVSVHNMFDIGKVYAAVGG
ncbi:ketosteroid isomerase family protein [Pseudomonas capsici]|uniref:ketosteroid isomerase family protein n=1 Tax=Pseudomonas capsici TaxID=2810614 RepID=UPI0021F1CFD2|nr:ketosteroid isomerase family protein [Pseudomonas capsici]MCV4264670.1 ketosteroid isomerase family protein [Pseudomonas capsici]